MLQSTSEQSCFAEVLTAGGKRLRPAARSTDSTVVGEKKGTQSEDMDGVRFGGALAQLLTRHDETLEWCGIGHDCVRNDESA